MSVKTPCVGICSTSIAGSVCRGCKRYAHEVIRWNAYSDEERRIVWQRLNDFRVQILGSWFEVMDKQVLAEQLGQRKIKFNADLEPVAWVYDLLRAGASQIVELESYGVRWVRPGELSLVELNEQIEQVYYQLSEAHYERYFDPGRQPAGD